jgi:hypothetical protein
MLLVIESLCHFPNAGYITGEPQDSYVVALIGWADCLGHISGTWGLLVLT